VRQQLQAVFAQLRPAACKTGMLVSSDVIRVIVRFFQTRRAIPLIVDPVMVAASGARLLEASALRVLAEQLLPRATLVTPNLTEAEAILGLKIRDEDGLREAARQLVRRFGCASLVKGGHLKGATEAVDVFHDGRKEIRLAAPFTRGIRTHGTGCTYSAAIAAYCARGLALPEAVRRAKTFITGAIAGSRRVGGTFALDWLSRSNSRLVTR
jgi:hydroxymethylpyrimidine kinase/phosphomethylpyrimidine kinase